MAVRRSKNGRRLGHIIGSVYLVHMNRALHGARHYLGFSTNVAQRVKAHKGGGVRLCSGRPHGAVSPGVWCAHGASETATLNRI